MKQYLEQLKFILQNGKAKTNRTGINTISTFGMQTRYDLKDGFPLITTKKVFFRGILHELLWFIAGDTNIKYLIDNNVFIWNEWAFERFKKSSDYHSETIHQFVELIKNDLTFANKHGELGPIYGKQWRNFNNVDQLKNVIEEIKNNPDSRRLIVNCWNPSEIEKMALPPCHTFFQFYISDNGKKLNLQLYQRSADMFLGVPFNIASYSLLLILVALECDKEVGEFIHTIGDAHIYANHLEQVEEQLTRKPFSLPQINIKNFKSIFEVKFEDVELLNYRSHSPIKGVVAV